MRRPIEKLFMETTRLTNRTDRQCRTVEISDSLRQFVKLRPLLDCKLSYVDFVSKYRREMSFLCRNFVVRGSISTW